MAERSFFQKLIKPTAEEKEEFKKSQQRSKKIIDLLEEEGLFKTQQILKEQEALDAGVPEEEVNKMASDFDKKAVMPKIEKFLKNPIDNSVKAVTGVFKEPKVEEEPRDPGLPPETNNEVSLSDSIGGAINSGLIKIPKGVVNFGTLVYDAMQEEGIPVERSATYKFNNAFENSYLGLIEKQAEDLANETATGRISEALVQLYGAGKIAQKTTVPIVAKLTQKARQLAPLLTKSIKGGKYVSTTKNAKNVVDAANKASQLNKLSKLDKFVGITIGGGIGVGAVVAKEEDIGTFGDFIDFIPTELDREKRPDAANDAARQLHNKLLFGAEYGFPIIPAVYGLGSIGKIIAQKGKDLAFSNSLIERWVDRWIAQPFRSRSFKSQEIFDATQKLEGTKAALKVTADDFARSVDDSLKRISRETVNVAEAVSPDTASGMIANFMMKTKDVVKKGQIYFDGFNKKVVQDFTTSMKKIGVSDKTINKVIGDAAEFRVKVADLKNSILQGGNITQGAEQFNDIISTRVSKFLTNDYKIVDANKGLIKGFKPTDEMKEEVAGVIQRYAKANNAPIDRGRARDIVENIIKNVEINPIEKSPTFPLGKNGIMDDSGVMIKNIGENITGGNKFKPDGKGGLIQTVSDLIAFKKLFGEYKNAKNVIYNVMGDLANITARDKFYTTLLKDSDKAIKEGGRGIFRKSYDEARLAFPNKEIITAAKGLKLPNRLSDEIYTSPLDGLFTTKEWADAIRMGDDLIQSGLTKSAAYRYLLLLPKGLVQVGKTVLGPVTQMRNVASNLITTLHNGNLLYFAANPRKFMDYIKQSTQAIQPQLLYKVTGNPKYRNTQQGQQLYKFLLEEGVTNQSTTFRDVEGILSDIQKGSGSNLDTFMNSVFETITKRIKGAYNIAQELYVGGDDWFRVFNFLGEAAKLDDAFNAAIKKGVIDPKTGKVVVKPSPLEIWKEAAAVVRETIPNYAYVSDFVKGVRRSPLGNFASFPAEIFRTGANNLQRGIKESKDPVRSVIGKTRLTGQALTYATVPVVAYEGARALYGISRDAAEAIREFVPDWSKDNTLLPVYEDGKYKYIDFSHGFFYDTLTSPVQSVLAKVDEMDEAPLLESIVMGTIGAIGNTLEPFVSESIFFGAMADIFIRKGFDDQGNRVWNPRDSFGDKLYKSIKHTTYKLSPGSFPQLKRLYKAAKGETIGGTQYEIPDELMGFFGARKVPIDVKKTMNFKIQDFREAERNERNLIFAGTLSGDPVEDDNKIIQQFIFANQQRLETYNSMRRTYDAAKVLGMRDKEIAELFEKRGMKKDYGFIKNNRFEPFTISKNMMQAYADLAKEKGIDNPLNKRTIKTIDRIIKQLSKQRLNKEYIINEDDYILKQSTRDQLSQLPPTPMPDQQVIQTAMMPASGVMNQGLTATENALLSEEEKQIRLRQRGLT